jgi:hypothetical protein
MYTSSSLSIDSYTTPNASTTLASASAPSTAPDSRLLPQTASKSECCHERLVSHTFGMLTACQLLGFQQRFGNDDAGRLRYEGDQACKVICR